MDKDSRLLQIRNAKTNSFVWTKNNFYAARHEQMPLEIQRPIFKRSYEASGGISADIELEHFKELEVFYEGQLTVYRSSGKNISEHSGGQDFISVNECNCAISRMNNFTNIFEFNDVVLCTSIGSYNIHVFIFEILPAIWLFRDLLQNKTIVIGGQENSFFMKEIFEMLDLDINLVIVPVQSKINATNSSILGWFPGRIYPIQIIKEIRKYVSNKFLNNKENLNKVTYLGRGDLERDRRKIVNEIEFIHILENSFGNINIIRPGLIPLAQTVKTLISTSIIIGPTGGALANLIWAPKLEKFIELKPMNYFSVSETEELSKMLDFKYMEVPTLALEEVYWSNSDQEIILDSSF